MKKNIEFFIKTCIAATFFVPLVLVPSSFIFPFIVPKIILFRSLALLMLGGYLLLLLHDFGEYKPKKTWTNYAVGLFFLSFAISTFVGVDWYHSFWDNHERMLGLFTIFHYVIYYLVVSSVMREWRDWRVLLYIFLLAGGVVMAIGVYQKGHSNFLLNQGSNRVSSTLGNPIYVGGYGLFLTFVGLLLFLKEKNNLMKVVAGLGMFLGAAGVFLSGTRGTLLGLLAGIGVLCVIYFLAASSKSLQKRFFGGLILFGLILFASIFIFRQTEFVRHIPTVGRLANTSISADTASTRLMAWSIAVDAWKERSVFGWGPNNYFYAFNKYYRPEFLRHGWNETWFDNAHSAIMNTFAVQGTFGGVLYFAIFILPGVSLLRARKKGIVDLHTSAIGTAFLVGHFVHNAFVFENPTSYLYFFFFLGFINSQTFAKSIKDGPATVPFSLVKTAGVSMVILFFLYSTNINPARANTATLDSLRVLSSPQAFDLSMYEDAFEIPSPHIDDIRNDFARSSIPIFSSDFKKLKEAYGEDVNKFFDFVYSKVLQNRSLHPLDIRTNILQAQIASSGARLKDDVKYMEDA